MDTGLSQLPVLPLKMTVMMIKTKAHRLVICRALEAYLLKTRTLLDIVVLKHFCSTALMLTGRLDLYFHPTLS